MVVCQPQDDTRADMVCAWRAEAFEQPVAIGGQQVLPDDHVLADRDGVIPIVAAQVEAILAASLVERLMPDVSSLGTASVRPSRTPLATLPLRGRWLARWTA